jgi:hypothetical protein
MALIFNHEFFPATSSCDSYYIFNHDLGSPRKTKPTASKLGSLNKLGMLPTHLSSSSPNLSKIKTDLEIELMYSDLFAEMVLEKKLLDDKKKELVVKMKNSQNETRSLRGKCQLLETRIFDVEYLSALNDEAENGIEDLALLHGEWLTKILSFIT